MGFKRRLIFWGVLVLVGSALSGCVVRPLWWGEHGSRHGERSGAYEEPQHRDEGRRREWR